MLCLGISVLGTAVITLNYISGHAGDGKPPRIKDNKNSVSQSGDDQFVRSRKRQGDSKRSSNRSLNIRAERLHAEDRIEEAIDHLDVAIERDPNDFDLIRKRTLYEVDKAWGSHMPNKQTMKK